MTGASPLVLDVSGWSGESGRTGESESRPNVPISGSIVEHSE